MLNRPQHKTLIEIADALTRIAECLEAQTGREPKKPTKRHSDSYDEFLDD